MDKLIPMELKKQRIMTTEILAEQYGTYTERIRQNYLRNEKRFVEGKHYYKLVGDELRSFKAEYLNDTNLKFAKELLLWTEKGAARHAKILDTDEAWEVYEELEETYFRVRMEQPKLSKELQAIFMLDGKQQELEQEIIVVKDEVKDLKDNLPLLGVDCDEITSLIKKVCTRVTGYETPAYKDKSLRGRVYSDVYGQVKREFQVKSYKAIKRSQMDKAIEIITNYKAPTVLLDEIVQVNNQISFKEEI